MSTTYLCKQCGRPGELRDNETYCEHCGPGVELVAAPDEETSVGVYEADPANQIAYAKSNKPAEAIAKAAPLAVMEE